MTPQWTEPAMWIGILRGDQLVALIIRRGMFDANGKCQVNVNDMRRVEARRIKAIDVEMHCVSLCDIGYLIPSDAILALGWTSGRFAFNYRGAPAVICDSARKGFSGGLRMLPHRLWPLSWTQELYENPGYSPFAGKIAINRGHVIRRARSCQKSM